MTHRTQASRTERRQIQQPRLVHRQLRQQASRERTDRQPGRPQTRADSQSFDTGKPSQQRADVRTGRAEPDTRLDHGCRTQARAIRNASASTSAWPDAVTR